MVSETSPLRGSSRLPNEKSWNISVRGINIISTGNLLPAAGAADISGCGANFIAVQGSYLTTYYTLTPCMQGREEES